MKRYGMVIRVRPELEDAYVHLHANTWPEVLQRISDCNMRNYTIFMRDGYLFAYYEYVGDDYGGRYGEDGGRPGHAGVVEADRSLPGAGGERGRRRALGGDGGGIPS